MTYDHCTGVKIFQSSVNDLEKYRTNNFNGVVDKQIFLSFITCRERGQKHIAKINSCPSENRCKIFCLFYKI